MTSLPGGEGDAGRTRDVPERRRNAALRALIDEMLSHVRGAQRESQRWTPEERASAEVELDRIMTRVRAAALPGTSGSDPSP